MSNLFHFQAQLLRIQCEIYLKTMRKKQKDQKKQLEPSKFSIQKQSLPKGSQQYCIYEGDQDSESSHISDSIQESSFELQKDEEPQQDRENIVKLLDRLGLKSQTGGPSTNQDLELVVNNFVQNCIGSVNRTVNTEEYDQIYDAAYQDKIKKPTVVSSIFVSELTDLQKIRSIQKQGLWHLYRRLRMFLKCMSILCQKLVQHVLFEGFILLIILANSIKMATDDPLATTTSLPLLQTTFTSIYVVEMLLKIFAFGFVVGRGAYLRDMWNIMDFVIVVTSLLPLVISLGFSVSALRAIRVLRPLRTITKIRALKMIVRTLFYSFSMVMDSLIILLFVMGVFAIAGMQLFGGTLKYTCMVQLTGAMTTLNCGSDSDCGNGYLCVKGIASPNYSIINFDTLFWSYLSVYQIISAEGWSLIMLYIARYSGIASSIYSIMILIVCNYVLLNMVLAILKYKYQQVKSNVIEEEEEDKIEYEPQFLKKIGVYKEVSILCKPASLQRHNRSIKKQIGCIRTLPLGESSINVSNQGMINYLQQPKASQKIEGKSNELDLKELKQIGRLQDYKWDVNNLYFETNQQQKELNPADPKLSSDKKIGQDQDVQDEDSSYLEESDSFYSEESGTQQDNREQQIIYKANEMQMRINQEHKDVSANRRIFEEVPDIVIKAPPTITKEHSQLDQLLRLIGTKPGITQKQIRPISIPDIDINTLMPDRIYQRFGDLGDFGLKRVKPKNELGDLDVVRKPGAKQEMKRKLAPVQQANLESALDLKELQLKNELSKKTLRFRVKTQQELNKERNYDITRVITSEKVRQIEQKKEQIRQNIKHLHFKVRYVKARTKKQNKKNEARSIVYARNIDSTKAVLKVPQIVKANSLALAQNKQQKLQKTQVDKDKDNNQYLKMLEQHTVEDRIQLKLDRIMTVFFNKHLESDTKGIISKKQASVQQEYQIIREDDILKRHGFIELECPLADQRQELLQQMNMKRQQYDIHIKGALGMLRVARKKALLFASLPIYDNAILSVVVLNTLLMSMSGFVSTDLPPYSLINQAFTFVFVGDLLIKLFAYGMGFFSDGMNLFDLGVVVTSLIELSLGSSSLSALRSIRILRAFRVLRITRLIRSLSYMRIIMGVVSSIISQFLYIFMLLWLFIFIYALLGMQIFGGTFPSQEVTTIRQDYDSFMHALFVIFQVMTIQNWNDIETKTVLSTIGHWGIIFLVSWIFLGNWILLNLLQAVLLDGFDQDSTDADQELSPSQQKTQEIATTEIDKMEDEQEEQGGSQGSDDPMETKSTATNFNYDQTDASLFLFQTDNPIRRACLFITSSFAFEVIMLILIICSSAKLAFDTYLTTSSPGYLILFSSIADYVFNAMFITECVMKVISQGFVVGEGTYLASSWNKLDFFIVCTSLLDMMMAGANLSIVKLMRTLRPLRIITRNEDMKVMVSSLAQSIIGIFNVLIICMCVFLMFAILGMNLLQGKLNFCNVTGNKLQIGNFPPYINQTACESQGGTWATQIINFQNVATSMVSLLIFETRENWPYYAYSFIDSSDSGPVYDNGFLLYFAFTVLFIFVASYFFMDMLVGVLFMNYHQASQKIRPKTLSDRQINWQNLQRIIIQEKPSFQLYMRPQNSFRLYFFQLVSNGIFQIGIGLIIVANIIVMCIDNDDLPKDQSATLSQINMIFSYLFIGEMLLKFVAYGRAYFLSAWNCFDFFVVSASILDIILIYSGKSSGGSCSAISILPQIARIFRVLRITRLLRLFKRFKGLQKLIETFIFSLPAISKGLAIFFLFLFISAVLGSYLMGNIGGDWLGTMNEVYNYQDFHHALQFMFVNLTGENWYFYMFYSTTPGYVYCLPGFDSCTSQFNYVFWIPFIFFGQKVFLQLFVLIVLDQFEDNYINQHNPLGIFALYEEDFRENWIEVTAKYHSQKIQAKRLIDLMLLLRPPLGLGRLDTIKKYQTQLKANDKITPQEIQSKTKQMDDKLKKTAARLLHKMNVMRNRIYFGYHQTFYNFAKLATVPQFIEQTTAQQKVQLQAMHESSAQALQKLKPEGNIFYYGELDGQESEAPLNPISLILFTQMVVKSWNNYALKGKKDINESKKKKKDRLDPYDSLNDSCDSDIEQAKYQKMDDHNRGNRRGGLIETKMKVEDQSSQFKATPNMMSAYAQGIKSNKQKNSMVRSSIIKGARNPSKIGRRSSNRNNLDPSIRRSSKLKDISLMLGSKQS